MNDQMKKITPLLMAAVVGSALTFAVTSFISDVGSTTSMAPAEEAPIYWIAPMDANYRRDKPGKSPMGMDLIAVYADGGSGSDSGPGTIKISPEVVNNLGVRTAVARMGTLHSQISTVGYVQYDEDQLVHIHPRVEGWIEKLFIKAAGDPVKKGQALYEIYSPALVNAQDELLLALDRNNKRLIRAAKQRLKALQLPDRVIKKLLKTRKVNQTVTFYAPQSGVLDNLNIREGFFVKPGSTLMSIGKLDQVWVEAELFERQTPDVVVGMPVTMTLDYLPGRKWEGKVDYIYPTLNAKTRTVKVRLRFDNKNEELKPNMFAQVIIHVRNEEASLLIPKESLIRTGTMDRVVLALGDGRFKSIEVQIGRYDDESIEVLSGISEGEMVVASAQFLLDSESSKSSDFKRMNYDAVDIADTSVWVKATVKNIMRDHRMLNLAHEAIDEWDWPSMTMDFTVADGVGLDQIEAGMTTHFELEKDAQGNVNIIGIHVSDETDESMSSMDETGADSATVNGIINTLMIDHKMLNISRGVIEKWNRPPATVDFIADEYVDLSRLEVGAEVTFTFEIRNGNFVITKIQMMGDAMSSTQTK